MTYKFLLSFHHGDPRTKLRLEAWQQRSLPTEPSQWARCSTIKTKAQMY